jgi:hypothetical protein
MLKLLLCRKHGTKERGHPKGRWLQDVEDDLKVKIWRQSAGNREDWRRIEWETKAVGCSAIG